MNHRRPVPSSSFWRTGSLCSCSCVCAPSCPTLLNPVDYSPPGSSVHGILQARILERGAISFSRGSSRHRDHNCILAFPALAGGSSTTSTTGKPTWASWKDSGLPESYQLGPRCTGNRIYQCFQQCMCWRIFD